MWRRRASAALPTDWWVNWPASPHRCSITYYDMFSQVSATFAASLVTSPALGAYLGQVYSETLVVAIATAVAVLDVFFILVAVPESLPEKVRPSSWGAPISWEQADPFAVSACFVIVRFKKRIQPHHFFILAQALKKVGKDRTILMLCVTVFLSYLPEAGQYSCFFVYLQLVSICAKMFCPCSQTKIRPKGSVLFPCALTLQESWIFMRNQ